MSHIHVSTIVTLHREGKYLPRTIQSLSEAATFAHARGLGIELIAVLDRPDAATRNIFQHSDLSAFQAVRALEVDNGSVSLSRNDGCAAATGEWFDMMDGDDLVSYTFIERMFDAAQPVGHRGIFVPKFSFGFGAQYYTVEYFNQDEIPAFVTVKYNLFTSKVFFHRSLCDELQYLHVPLSKGYAYEDWHFNCGAMAAGYRFRAVENAVLFYRQRLNSRNHEADRISSRQIPPSPLFQPARFRQTFAETVKRYGDAGARAKAPSLRGFKVFSDPVYRDLTVHANRIDPAVDIGHYDWDCLGHFCNFVESRIGIAYYRACEIVRSGTFDDVFLLSSRSGEAASLFETLQDMARADPSRRILVVFDHVPDDAWQDDYPPHASVVPVYLSAICGGLSDEDQDLISYKLIQACASTSRLHFAPCHFGRKFFSRFAKLLRSNFTICHRPPDGSTEAFGVTFVDPTYFNLLSENLDSIDEVITATPQAAFDDRRRLGFGRAVRYRGCPP